MAKYTRIFKQAIKISTLTCIAGTGITLITRSHSKQTTSADWNPFVSTCDAAVDIDPFPYSKPASKWDFNWDKRDPAYILENRPKRRKHSFSTPITNEDKAEVGGDAVKESRLSPMASRHLILIRHGQYEIERESDEERILTELGKEQSLVTGERLKSLGYNYSILYHSTMNRARETADIIYTALGLDKLPKQSCDLIREGAPVPPEPPLSHWRPDSQKFFEDGARIEAGFRKYFHRADLDQEKDSYEIIVCHANVIRYYVCRALQFPPEGWLRISLPNSSITWLTIRPNGRVSLRALGDSGHLPPDKVTTS